MHPSCERPAQDDAGLAVVAQPLELCPAFLAMGRDLAHPNLVTNHLNWLGALSLAPEKKKGFSFFGFHLFKTDRKKGGQSGKNPLLGNQYSLPFLPATPTSASQTLKVPFEPTLRTSRALDSQHAFLLETHKYSTRRPSGALRSRLQARISQDTVKKNYC